MAKEPRDVTFDDLPELECPGCGSDLAWDDRFLRHRVCSTCHRHFFISARERLSLVLDEATFEETATEPDRFAPIEPDQPAGMRPSSAQRFAESRERDVINDAVVTGTGSLDGGEAVFAILDEHATGVTLGALTTEKLLLAMDRALQRRLPFVIMVAGGNASTSSGPLSLAQPTRIAAAAAQLHLAGVPMIGVLCQSASSELVGTLAGQCDVIVAETGTRVWDRRPGDGAGAIHAESTEDLLACGVIDDVIERDGLRPWLTTALGLLGRRPQRSWPGQEATPEQDAALPVAAALVERIVTDRIEIRGDRIAGDDPQVRAGIGRLARQSVAWCAFDRAESEHGAMSIRKMTRMIGLASRFELPLLLVIGRDTPATLGATEAVAIARLGGMLAASPVPVVVCIAGEVQSALGRSLVCGDRIIARSTAAFGIEGSVPGHGRLPSGSWSTVSAADAQRLGLIDEVIEPGAGDDRARLLDAIVAAFADLGTQGTRRTADRLQRIRAIGQSTPAGRAALRDELNDWREWQRNLARSVEDWRGRWEQLRNTQPRLTIQRPDLGDLASRLRARRDEFLERTGRSDKWLR